MNSKLHTLLKNQEPHRTLLALYRELLGIRRDYALAGSSTVQIFENGTAITMIVGDATSKTLAAIFEFGKVEHNIDDLRLPDGVWSLRLNSADTRWRGPGNSTPLEIKPPDTSMGRLAARSFVILERPNPTPE